MRPLSSGPDWQKLQRMKQQVCNTCIALGIPIDKFAEGTSVEFLGTGADSAAMIAFIPEARRLWAIEHLSSWLKRKFASKSLQSLAGNLQWLSNVVLWGRPHIRAIIAASSRWGKSAIPLLIRSGVRWWIQVLQRSPTVPLLYFCPFAPDVVIDSDASSTGFGAWSPTLRVYLFGPFSKAEIKDSAAPCRGQWATWSSWPSSSQSLLGATNFVAAQFTCESTTPRPCSQSTSAARVSRPKRASSQPWE